MNYSPKALFPGILIGILALVFLTGMIDSPGRVNASTPDVSQHNGQSGAPNGSAECSLPGSYPEQVRQWCGLIEEYADQQGIEARLLAALMLQESGGNPQAYSKDGAVGLLQVMPRDGIAAGFTCPNGPCFAGRPSMDELFDPEYNISYGSSMLAGLINKYGNVREALKAYGPMNVGYYYADIVLGIYEGYR